MPALNNAARSRRRVKYTEQPFPQNETKATTQINQQTQSPLFNVPKELRNRFFNLAYQNTADSIDIGALFNREEDETSDINRGTSAPPSAALILTCRRIFDECKTTFDSASSMYWQKDFVINVPEHPRVSRSLDAVPDDFVAHIRKYKVIVSFQGMSVAITLRAKTDGYWHLDASRHTGSNDEQLATLETSLRERLAELQGPRSAVKAFQNGKPRDGAFKAFTSDGLRDLLL